MASPSRSLTRPRHPPPLSLDSVQYIPSSSPATPRRYSHAHSRSVSQLPSQSTPLSPHERVLRARLEKVLADDRAASPQRRTSIKSTTSTSVSRRNTSCSASSRGDNDVRDESGARPLRRHDNEQSPSPSSRRARSPSRIPRPATPSHTRNRSRTDPTTSLLYSHHQQPSPRRASTAPTQLPTYSSPLRRHTAAGPTNPTGTTPPLESDRSLSKLPLDPSDEDNDDLKLLTPPPTPPSYFTCAASGAASPSGGYIPSPYVVPNTSSSNAKFGIGLLNLGLGRPSQRSATSYDDEAEEEEEEEMYLRSRSLARRPVVVASPSSDISSSSRPPSRSRSPTRSPSPSPSRKPRGVPTHAHSQSTSSFPTHRLQPLSFRPTASSPSHHRRTPTSPDLSGAVSSTPDLASPRVASTTFNARKASAQVYKIDGYVSFATIEGLGTPGNALDDEDEAEMERGRARTRKAGVGGLGMGLVEWGWRRLLGVAGVNASGSKDNTAQQPPLAPSTPTRRTVKEGVVL